MLENRAARLQLLDIGSLLSISLAKVVLGVTVHRDVFPGAQKDGDLMGFHFPVAEGDDVEEALGLWTVIRIIVLAGEYLDADVLREVSHLHGVEGELVPARNGRIEVVVEEGITVSIVGPGPGEKYAFLVRPGIDIVGLVTILDLVSHPNPLGSKALGGHGEFKHFIGYLKIGAEHFLGQLDSAVGIKVVGSSVLRNVPGQVEFHAEKVVGRMNELVATNPAEGIRFVFKLALGQPIQHHTFLLGAGLLLILRRHLRRDQVLEGPGVIGAFFLDQSH